MTQQPPSPSGTIENGPSGLELHLFRRFRSSIEEVWAAITESGQLERWIGRWEGDPATGRVQLFMVAEGEDVSPGDVEIVECQAPRQLVIDTSSGGQQWHLRLELSREPEATVLLFVHTLGDDELSDIGPGWEYYLDRLGAVLSGGEPDSVLWDDYFPALSEYYASLGDN